MGAIDTDVGDDAHKVNHVDGVDVGVIADVRGLFGGEFVALCL